MKTARVLLSVILIGSFLSVGLSACGKKDNKSNDQSSVNSDGQTVTISPTSSAVTVGGQAISLQLRNIQAYGYGSIRFDMTLNGAVNSFNSMNQFQNYTQMSGLYVTHAAACADNSCSVLYLSVVIAGTNNTNCSSTYACQYEYKQIAIKKVNNVIPSGAAGLREWNVGTNSQSLMTLQQVMSTF